MSPENILRSDVLDIVFEHRNKSYGAYSLRKYYNQRLAIAIVIVTILAGLSAFTVNSKKTVLMGTEVFLSDTVPMQPIEPVKPPEPEQPQPRQQLENIATIQDVVPRIVPDEEADVPVPDAEIAENAVISDYTSEGNSTGERLMTEQRTEETTGVNNIPEPDHTNEILTFAEKMPSFPGGTDAFKKYMLKNLMQPDDMEEGQKIVVIARFIVRSDGTIDESAVIKTGRPDLDREVLRVIRKMPQWLPGVQNGKNVSVWFQLPVTFVSEN